MNDTGRPKPQPHPCDRCGRQHSGRYALCGSCKKQALADGE